MVRALVPTLLALLCSGAAYAQSPAGDASEDQVPEGIPLREAYLERLEATQVHFTFRRAPLQDVLVALELASGVPVRLGESAAKLLERRKFKLRYVADRTGLQVLEDLAKAAALDFEVTDDGALVDATKSLAPVRRELGLEPRRVSLSADDVTRMLDDKRLTLVARERSLVAVLAFLRRETGIRYVHVEAPEEAPWPKLTAEIQDAPLGEVLTRLLEPLELAWIQRGAVILVGPRATIEAQGR